MATDAAYPVFLQVFRSRLPNGVQHRQQARVRRNLVFVYPQTRERCVHDELNEGGLHRIQSVRGGHYTFTVSHELALKKTYFIADR